MLNQRLFLLIGTNVKGNSGDLTPVSTSSDWEFNTNEATVGSTTEQDILVKKYLNIHFV